MPILNCPFTAGRPFLPLRIINPHTGKAHRAVGIVDTGADECAVPAFVARILGHDLSAGKMKQIKTGNGITNAYSHTTRLEIFHPRTNQLLYTIMDTPIDFLPNLHVVLLGVNSFLSKFILSIDYPKKVFSIKSPP
jgi:hypothetical protein